MITSNDEWNASLQGDYLWSNVNFGEAVTETMTPLTWSVIQFTLDDWRFLPGYPTVGNIGGMPYLNISIFATLFQTLGRSQEDLLEYMEGTLYMQLPTGMQIPPIKLSLREKLAGMLSAVHVQFRQYLGIRQLAGYIAETPTWFEVTRTRLDSITQTSDLVAIWKQEITPHIKKGVWCVLGSANYSSAYALNLRRDLTQLVGAENANILIGKLGDKDDLLESLGLVAGLSRLASGELSKEAYLAKYGHRGPNEFELSTPPPAEDYSWVEEELKAFQRHPVDLDEMLANQAADYQSVRDQLQRKHPRRAARLHKRILENARRARLREQARSEYTRDRWLMRLFALRAAELTGLQEEIFFLQLNEILALLLGDQSIIGLIPARMEIYHQYKTLPAYPSVIRGHFDPIQWAANPNRRSNVFDATTNHVIKTSNLITGSPGSAGQVTGIVRIISHPDQGQTLQPGEILVAVQTDVAWTVLFPRSAAIITDVGAPLSHAAIVARELGIPAVVGCGDATTRLRSGDQVRVDGAQGCVKILNKVKRK